MIKLATTETAVAKPNVNASVFMPRSKSIKINNKNNDEEACNIEALDKRKAKQPKLFLPWKGFPKPIKYEQRFIANNEREPVRYRIETEHGGYISSEHELGEQLLQADKEHSELLNYDNYQQQQQHSNNEHNNNNPNQYQLESGKRIKRDNKQTDDAPELNSQSNLNVAIRQAKRSHLRVKRS
ncbi:GH10089 [Drosophila grimshawi]|uniref:GH10089 n=1 Tax=Drosophila grimshawi TaxID=7222 RepID=B4JD04_DROGR|nr:GH10089 [Drosophila grimshawi]